MSSYVVVGAGLTGSLAAVRLARAGHPVELVEKRADLRVDDADAGRSINLALSVRGLDALDRIGIGEAVKEEGIPMRGRMMHDRRGKLTFQPYGTEAAHVITSVSRDGLNIALLDALDAEAGITTRFRTGVIDIDIDRPAVRVEGENTGTLTPHVIVGADGAYSAVRQRLQKSGRFSYEQEYLEHGYKELTIPPNADGDHRLDPNALHIWPRGEHMMIALPNPDGSFTCTLFWPYAGTIGFESILDEQKVHDVFAEHFPDAGELMPNLAAEYLANPTSSLVTIRCQPWHHDDKVVLLGDAAHAVVPFYGQGANAALEDVTILMEELERATWDRGLAFDAFFERRKPDADALADLALDNFIEMRDHVASKSFLLQKRVKQTIGKLAGSRFEPLYEMVTFSRRPYAEAVGKAARQDRVLGVVAIAIALLLALILFAVVLLLAV